MAVPAMYTGAHVTVCASNMRSINDMTTAVFLLKAGFIDLASFHGNVTGTMCMTRPIECSELLNAPDRSDSMLVVPQQLKPAIGIYSFGKRSNKFGDPTLLVLVPSQETSVVPSYTS